MSYIIYNNIKETEFNILHKRILKLIPCFKTELDGTGFKINNETDLADILGLDFLYNVTNTYGNLGFKYNDEINLQSFTFYVTKAVDMNSYRYFKKISINEHLSIDEIELNFASLISESIHTFKNMNPETFSDSVYLGD